MPLLYGYKLKFDVIAVFAIIEIERDERRVV
jgi:hypothetical protein